MFKFIRFLSSATLFLGLILLFFGGNNTFHLLSYHQDVKLEKNTIKKTTPLKVTAEHIESAIHEAAHVYFTLMYVKIEECSQFEANIIVSGEKTKQRSGIFKNNCVFSTDKADVLVSDLDRMISSRAGYYAEHYILKNENTAYWRTSLANWKEKYEDTKDYDFNKKTITNLIKLINDFDIKLEDLQKELERRLANLNNDRANRKPKLTLDTSSDDEISLTIKEVIEKQIQFLFFNDDNISWILLFAEALIIANTFETENERKLKKEDIQYIYEKRTFPPRLLKKKAENPNFNYLPIGSHFKLKPKIAGVWKEYSNLKNNTQFNGKINNGNVSKSQISFWKDNLNLSLFIFFLVFWFFIFIFIFINLLHHWEIYLKMQSNEQKSRKS